MNSFGELCLYSAFPVICLKKEGCNECQIFIDYQCPLCEEEVTPGELFHLECALREEAQDDN